MHTLSQNIGVHANLGRAIEQTGGNRLWKQLILLLHQHPPFNNTLAISYLANGVPVVLEEYDAEPHARPASALAYLNGSYLFGPSHQTYREGLASGLYRFGEIVPDHFRQNEYHLSYLHDNVPEGEVQFILQAPGQSMLSLPLSIQRMLADEECGILGLLSSRVLALIQQHWQQCSQRLLPVTPQEEIATQIRDALSHFGASVLSERELEIIRLTFRGYSSKAIAECLAVSPEAIKVHRRHLYVELDISSQPELFSLFTQPLGHDPENPQGSWINVMPAETGWDAAGVGLGPGTL